MGIHAERRAVLYSLMRGVALALLFFALGIGVSWLWRSREQLRVGKPAPDFTLPALDGRLVRLRDYQGRVVVLNFWATWCTPCQEEMPLLDQLHRSASEELVVLAVNQGERPEQVQAFLEQHQLRLPVLLDRDTRVSRQYGVRGLPTTIVIDPTGRIAAIHAGLLTPEDLRTLLAPWGVPLP